MSGWAGPGHGPRRPTQTLSATHEGGSPRTVMRLDAASSKHTRRHRAICLSQGWTQLRKLLTRPKNRSPCSCGRAPPLPWTEGPLEKTAEGQGLGLFCYLRSPRAPVAVLGPRCALRPLPGKSSDSVGMAVRAWWATADPDGPGGPRHCHGRSRRPGWTPALPRLIPTARADPGTAHNVPWTW